MAEGGSDEFVEKVVCGICSNNYKNPKLLPCYHSYCYDCIYKYVEKNSRNNKFDCPLCQKPCDIPGGGIKQFEDSITKDSTLRTETVERHECDVCGPDINAESHCNECDENYCEACTNVHIKQKLSRTHTLLSISGSKGAMAVNKREFCEKHPQEDVKVVCKDCNKMLCIVCKLTGHEKHNSVDIGDEAVSVKKKLKTAIQKVKTSVTKLDKLKETLNVAKAESLKNRDNTLEELRDYGKTLKDQIDKKICKIEAAVNSQYDQACANIASLTSETERVTTSLVNITDHANQVVCVLDINSLVAKGGKVHKQLEECLRKADAHKARTQPMIYSQWGKHLAMINSVFLLKQPNTITIKSVARINQRLLNNEEQISLEACSLSVSKKFCAMSCPESESIVVVSSQGDNVIDSLDSNTTLLCAVEDRIFLSYPEDKLVKVVSIDLGKIIRTINFDMHPHGIAHRFNNGLEELVICFLKDDSDFMTTEQSQGTVRVVPLEGRKTPYDFYAEATPAPTRVAVSKLDGLVCLSFPSVGRITLRTKDGMFVHNFNKKALGMGPTLFRPYGICFDSENCIIIADMNAKQVVRVTLFGQIIQTLTKGNCPTAVGISHDDKLWVGYEDKNVTLFQLTNRCQ